VSNESTANIEQRMFNEKQAARFLGLAVQTMRRWRYQGDGPRYRKLRGAVRYDLADLCAFIEKAPTSGKRTNR
jgi:predicted DNA-binding transcriptional regulator AlpA